MPKRTYSKPLRIDMDFEEALERFGTTDPKDLPDNIKLSGKDRSRDQKRRTKKSQVAAKSQ